METSINYEVGKEVYLDWYKDSIHLMKKDIKFAKELAEQNEINNGKTTEINFL